MTAWGYFWKNFKSRVILVIYSCMKKLKLKLHEMICSMCQPNQYPPFSPLKVTLHLFVLVFWFQDGFVHIYDLQTGQWVTSFQAALGIHIMCSTRTLNIDGCMHIIKLNLVSWSVCTFQIPWTVSLSIHICLWLPRHRGTADLLFLMMATRICIWVVIQLTLTQKTNFLCVC